MTFGTGILRSGSTDAGVTELQQWLIDRSFLIAHAAPSGTFDDVTFHAVRAFQFSAGIGVDGVVGDGTRTAADGFAGTALTTGWHPAAIRNVVHDRHGGAYTTTTRRGVIHTTETDRLPAYSTGNVPHFTLGSDGAGNPVQLWQHLPVTVAARALANEPGGVQTNRHGAIQIEIIGYAANSPTMAADQPAKFQALRDWMRWIEANHGVARESHHAFAGSTVSATLSDADWEASTGWLGHQHVPENINRHWDPGIIDIAALLAVAATPTGGTVGGPRPAPAVPPMSMSNPAAAIGAPPRITATTRRLTNAFPSLTFSVTTEAPFYEVILTTDRTLFAPDRTASRTDMNFYASRVDGLRSTERSNGRFVTPVSVIQRFADSAPDGAPIYFTVVAYSDDQGNGAMPAAAPSELAQSAPAVQMMPGFRGHTTTETLGVPLSMLKPSVRQLATVGGRPRSQSSDAMPAAPTIGTDRPPDPATDRLEGEDGYDVPRSRPTPPVGEGPSGTVDAPDVGARAPAPQVVPDAGGGIDTVAAGYDDGWGAGALSSTFPRGQAQPRALYDAEAPLVGPDDEFDSLDWAGTPYGATDSPSTPSEPTPAAAPSTSGSGTWRPIAARLSPAQKRDVIEAFVGEDSDLYSAVNPDGEFAGSAGTDHPAYRRYHLGLSFGLAGFSQDDGSLGQLLSLMHDRDAAAFGATFGDHADELLETLNRPGPLSKDAEGGRSARVQPVGGTDVWEEPWRGRFIEAGRHRPFRGAQIELAAGMFLDPVMQFATDLGLASERGLAMIFDRAAHRGVTGGLNWIVETVGPVQTPVLLREALDVLGYSDVESFQRSQPDLLVDDQFGPLTHAAITAALRSSGATSPPVLSPAQMIVSLAERATGQPWGDRLVRLARADLGDDPLQAVPET